MTAQEGRRAEDVSATLEQDPFDSTTFVLTASAGGNELVVRLAVDSSSGGFSVAPTVPGSSLGPDLEKPVDHDELLDRSLLALRSVLDPVQLLAARRAVAR